MYTLLLERMLMAGGLKNVSRGTMTAYSSWSILEKLAMQTWAIGSGHTSAAWNCKWLGLEAADKATMMKRRQADDHDDDGYEGSGRGRRSTLENLLNTNHCSHTSLLTEQTAYSLVNDPHICAVHSANGAPLE